MGTAPQQGRFITFEGGEGTGKSTQSRRLAEYLRGKGLEVIETREPGGTPRAERLRDIMLSTDEDDHAWDPLSELFIVCAGRVDHVNRVIRPAIARGAWVICDRFNDSSIAYQGFGRHLPLIDVSQVLKIAVDAFEPDLTLILDMDPADALARVPEEKRRHYFEGEAIPFHQRLREGYRFIAERHRDRCRMIDASGELNDVTDAIRLEVDRFLASSLQPA